MLTLEKLKDYALKMEGVAEGFKSGVNETLKWIALELAKEEAEKKTNEKTENKG